MLLKSILRIVICITLLLTLITPNLSRAENQSNTNVDSDLRLLYSELLIHIKLGQYDRVIAGCESIIIQDCSFLEAYYLLVQAASKLTESTSNDELGQVIHFLNELCKSNPENSFYHFGLGLAYKHRKDFSGAREYFRKSINHGAMFWAAYEEQIDSLVNKQEFDETIEELNKLVERDSRNPYVFQGLGRLYFWLNDYITSLKYYDQALRLIKTKKAQKAEARCLFCLAHLYVYLNDYSKATVMIKKSIRISREIGDRLEEAHSLLCLASIYLDTGNHRDVFKLCSEALTISRQLASEKIEAASLFVLGMMNTEIGQYSKAKECLEKSARYYKNLNELQRLGIDYYWLSDLYKEIGDYSKALENAKYGLKISQQLGFKTGETFHLAMIGDIYFSFGNYEKALKFNKEALAISEIYTSKWSREECYNTIGYVYIEMNAYQEALDYFQRALEYVQNIEHTREEAECLYNLGVAYFKKGDESKAQSYFLQSLEKSDLRGKKAIMGMNLNRLGDLSKSSYHFMESQEYYSMALSIGMEIGHPNIIWEAYFGLGGIHAAQKNFLIAVEYYKKAIGVVEDLRSQFLVTEYRAGFFRNKICIYENLVNILYELHALNPSGGYDLECFYFAEKAKARAFLDDLQKAQIDFGTLDSKNQTEIKKLSKRISHILTKLSNSQLRSTERKELWREMEEAEEDLQNLVGDVIRNHPEYAKFVGLDPLRLDEIQKLLLNKGVGLIEYMVGEKYLFIFFCTENCLTIHRMSSKTRRSTLELVSNYVRLLSSRRFTPLDCEIAGRRLCERLIQPIVDNIDENVDKLIIIPDRGLYYLPFESLVCNNSSINGKKRPTYLMEQFRISYAPSATTLVHIINKRSTRSNQKDLLAIGDPIYQSPVQLLEESGESDEIVQGYYLEKEFNFQPLKYAFKELKSIARLFRKKASVLITQTAATEENIKKLRLDNFRIIHFATHSLLDEKNSNRSALVLKLDDDPEEDGFFQVREIYNIKLKADLVVLSACQTAKGKIEQGEGIQGMTRAFFYAGTKSVLASLWNINDKSTAEFMKYFYGFLSKGLTKQEALIRAKIRMLDSNYQNPYYWASFVLIGDSDNRIDIESSSLVEKILSFLRLD